MSWTKEHLAWLKKRRLTVKTADGKPLDVYAFKHEDSGSILSALAKHLRNHYCLDTDIDILRSGTPHSRKEYLESLKFPDRTAAPGPSIRAGDFAEILIADFVEHNLNYWVPRTRYADKTVRNESTKGSDIIGFRILTEGRESADDSLALYEAKALFSATQKTSRLQDAIDDSAKDPLRKAESLNAIKQRLLNKSDLASAKKVERFQNPEDHPYVENYGAAALFSSDTIDFDIEKTTTTANHPARSRLHLVIVIGASMMDLTHSIYARAADEA